MWLNNNKYILHKKPTLQSSSCYIQRIKNGDSNTAALLVQKQLHGSQSAIKNTLQQMGCHYSMTNKWMSSNYFPTECTYVEYSA